MDQIYLDNNATTFMDPRVRDYMFEFSEARLGNPSNHLHEYGRNASRLLEEARLRVQESLGADAYRVVFVSGATEGLNLVVQSWAGGRTVLSCTEHKAVTEPVRWMSRASSRGAVTLPVNSSGRVDVDVVKGTLDATSEPTLLAIQMANSETGVLQPIEEVIGLAEGRPALTLVDASQALGKVGLNMRECTPDFLVLSSHKIHGPAGVGALLIRKSTGEGRLRPLLLGGGQESGIRSGTENLLGICGFAFALELAVSEQPSYFCKVSILRDMVEASLARFDDQVLVNGRDAPRLPNTSNFSLRRLHLDDCLQSLGMLAVSAGSACDSREAGPSKTLLSMWRSNHEASNAVRISFGRFNTTTDARTAADQLEAYFESRREGPDGSRL